MIIPEKFYEALQNRGIDFFTGVPDSLLKHFCAYVTDRCGPRGHVIAANEGNAVAMAAGYHLSTGKVAAVYMQNSGLGNAVNPLVSLVDPEVCRIPLFLIIGWRGEPGVKDEPQHIKQGRITPGQLALLKIPYQIMDADSNPENVIDAVLQEIKQTNAPAALLVRKGTFASYNSSQTRNPFSALAREEALQQILALAGNNHLIVSTTGKTSREVFEIRAASGDEQRDFLMVGSMGHTASIALGVALGNPEKRVICLDGDGAALMHLGALPVIGDIGPKNLIYVLLNNGAHESVGGQRTVADRFDFAAMARACGFQAYRRAKCAEDLNACWDAVQTSPGPVMLEVRIRIGSRNDLGRPTGTPEENKKAFMAVAND